MMMNQMLQLRGSIFHGTTLTPTTLDALLPPPSSVVPETAPFPAPLYQLTTAPANEATHSGLTFNDNRKRPREYYDDSMLDYDRQRELDCLVSLHMQRLKMELEERAERRSKVLVAVVREAVTAVLREKDEEISRLSKLNWALQEKIRGLSVENDLWRGLAQSNEAAANSLRADLERVLTSPGIIEDRKHDDDDDAGSCCGSSDGASEDGKERDDVGSAVARRECKGGCGGRREAGVMVMPCRHLCLCTACGSGSRRSCPVCGSAVAASIHVNFSDSS